ncbi:MAG: hypothetical protein ACRDLF_02970 [Solirubrobacteraceae bacterium]
MNTITQPWALPPVPEPGQIVHINDFSLLHEDLPRKRRYAMTGYSTVSVNGLVTIEIIPMTHCRRGPAKVSFFDDRCRCHSYLCFGLITLLTPQDLSGRRVRITPHFVPGARVLLAQRPTGAT